MQKLKSSQVRNKRLELLAGQDYTCALCRQPVSEEQAVLDHCHKSGAVRATLHRGCNSLLGKLENNYKRYGVNIDAFVAGVGQYLETHKENQTGLIHPTHKTPEEKKALKKKRVQRQKLAK